MRQSEALDLELVREPRARFGEENTLAILKTGMKPLMDSHNHLQRLQSNGQAFKWKETYKSRSIHLTEDGSTSRIFFKIRVLFESLAVAADAPHSSRNSPPSGCFQQAMSAVPTAPVPLQVPIRGPFSYIG